MAAPVADSYGCASGGVIAGGRHLLPDWLPAHGTFANISLNTLNDVKPAGYASETAGPFVNWAGGVFVADFGTKGGLAVYGSGHLQAGTALWSGVWVFDLATRMWCGRNVPSSLVVEGGTFDDYGISTATETAGHPYPPHTYFGLVAQPAACGGSADGSLIRFFAAGSSFKNAVYSYDLSSLTAPPTRVLDQINMGWNGGVTAGAYPSAAHDPSRNGIWLTSYDGSTPLKFISYADWSVSTYGASVGYYGDDCLTYIPGRDLLVFAGRNAGDKSVWAYSILRCSDPSSFTTMTVTGTAPPDSTCGMVWSTLLNCLVAYGGHGSSTVYKLTPPPIGEELTGTWTWTSETLTGVSGVSPSQNSIGAAAGTYRRFVEVPNLRCFIWCDGISQPTQAWRLIGM